MKKPLIHIGYHKTGSTWLQREFFGRTDRGFHPLALGIDDDELDPKAFARRFLRISPFDFDPAALLEEVAKLNSKSHSARPVISHERLSGSPDSGGYDSREIANRLHEVFPEAAILIVIREQTSQILSCYHQYLKVGGACSLIDYISKRDGLRPSFSLAHFRYHHLIHHYRGLFGNENILALPYEMLRDTPTVFAKRIASFAGAQIPDELPFEVRHNVSAGRFVATKTRWLNLFACRNSLNGFSPLAPEQKWPVLLETRRRLSRLVPRPLEASCKQKQLAIIAQQTVGYFPESNRITSDLIGIDLSQYGYAIAEGTAKPCAA